MQIFNVIKSFYGKFYAIHNSRFLQRLATMWVTCFFLLSGKKPRSLPHKQARDIDTNIFIFYASSDVERASLYAWG